MWMEKVLMDLGILDMFTESDNNGWRSTKCCYCSDTSQHLGINVSSGAVKCWRCGKHYSLETLHKLSYRSKSEIIEILKRYREDAPRIPKLQKSSYKPLSFKYSPDLKPIDKAFLRQRNFSPRIIQDHYDIRASSHMGNMHHRLIIPVYFNNQLVAYQGRDVTGKAKMRYLSSDADVVGGIDIKRTLYSYDKASIYDRVLVVEGPTDVWRLGSGAVSTYGSQFSADQIVLIARFTTRFIMYDNEPEAQEMAQILCDELSVFNGHTERITWEDAYKDGGELPDEDSEYIMKELGFRK